MDYLTDSCFTNTLVVTIDPKIKWKKCLYVLNSKGKSSDKSHGLDAFYKIMSNLIDSHVMCSWSRVKYDPSWTGSKFIKHQPTLNAVQQTPHSMATSPEIIPTPQSYPNSPPLKSTLRPSTEYNNQDVLSPPTSLVPPCDMASPQHYMKSYSSPMPLNAEDACHSDIIAFQVYFFEFCDCKLPDLLDGFQEWDQGEWMMETSYSCTTHDMTVNRPEYSYFIQSLYNLLERSFMSLDYKRIGSQFIKKHGDTLQGKSECELLSIHMYFYGNQWMLCPYSNRLSSSLQETRIPVVLAPQGQPGYWNRQVMMSEKEQEECLNRFTPWFQFKTRQVVQVELHDSKDTLVYPFELVFPYSDACVTSSVFNISNSYTTDYSNSHTTDYAHAIVSNVGHVDALLNDIKQADKLVQKHVVQGSSVDKSPIVTHVADSVPTAPIPPVKPVENDMDFDMGFRANNSMEDLGDLDLDAVVDDDFAFFDDKPNNTTTLTPMDINATPHLTTLPQQTPHYSPSPMATSPAYNTALTPFVSAATPCAMTPYYSAATPKVMGPESPPPSVIPTAQGPMSPIQDEEPITTQEPALVSLSASEYPLGPWYSVDAVSGYLNPANDINEWDYRSCMSIPSKWSPFCFNAEPVTGPCIEIHRVLAHLSTKYGPLGKWNYRPRRIIKKMKRRLVPCAATREIPAPPSTILPETSTLLDTTMPQESLDTPWTFDKCMSIYDTRQDSFTSHHGRVDTHQSLDPLVLYAIDVYIQHYVSNDTIPSLSPLVHCCCYYSAIDTIKTALIESLYLPENRDNMLNPESPMGIKGLLTLQQLCDVQDNERQSKYGKFQLKKKKKTGDHIYELLSIPDVVFGHDGQTLQASWNILKFWDSCRLEPISGPKKISCLALFPSTIVPDHVATWFKQAAQVYSTCRLGHLYPSDLGSKGLFAVQGNLESSEIHRLASGDPKDYFEALKPHGKLIYDLFIIAHDLAKALLGLAVDEYIALHVAHNAESDYSHVYAFVEYLWGVCGWIQSEWLPQVTHEALFEYSRHKIILRLVPLKEWVSPGFCAGRQLSLKQYAFSLYSSCKERLFTDKIPTEQDDTVFMHSPLFTMAAPLQAPPFSLDIPASRIPLLNVEPDRILHVAYTHDSHWISYCWCDVKGEFTGLVTLKKSGIWQKDITSVWNRLTTEMGSRGFRWRCLIAKYGILCMEEVQVWNSLFQGLLDPLWTRPLASVSLLNVSESPHFYAFDASCSSNTAPVSGAGTPAPSGMEQEDTTASPAVGEVEERLMDDMPTLYAVVQMNHRMPTWDPHTGRPSDWLPFATGWLVDMHHLTPQETEFSRSCTSIQVSLLLHISHPQFHFSTLYSHWNPDDKLKSSSQVQSHHVAILRDVLKQYHVLRFYHSLPPFIDCNKKSRNGLSLPCFIERVKRAQEGLQKIPVSLLI